MNAFLFSSSASNNRSDSSALTGGKAKMQSPAPRILVVDDEKVIADTIVQILNKNGFIAEAAYSGEEAIEKATRRAKINAAASPISISNKPPPPSVASERYRIAFTSALGTVSATNQFETCERLIAA